MAQIPPLSSLPLKDEDPPFSAWGLYGPSDELGTINRLTKEVVLAAARSEIQTGERFSLNWPLDSLGNNTFVGRKAFDLQQWNKAPRVVNDDVWHFNSQGSTQWDGLRHFAYQKQAKFYNGVTLDDMFNADGTIKSTQNGVEKWEKKGIVGRGILIDYDRWRRTHNIEYDALPSAASDWKPSRISLDDLKAILKEQGTKVTHGDILFVRTGFTSAYNSAPDDQRQSIAGLLLGSGVDQSEEMLAWLWDNFAAVAGDHVSFEAWPSKQPWLMHEVLLAGWGMPIGELFDLEALAEHCAEVKRWSFFLTSEVCNVPGAVAR